MNRRFLALLSCIVFAAAVAACGGSGNSNTNTTSSSVAELGAGGGGAVAQVEGVGSVSKATLDHWVPIEAALIYEETPKRAIPKGVVPDPPAFTACIAYLMAHHQKLVEPGGPPTTAQLKIKCGARLRELQEITLNTLIDWYWTLGQGATLGLKVTNSEIRQRFQEVSARLFPGKQELSEYLERTGQTIPDMLFRSKVQLFEVKLGAKLAQAEKEVPASLTGPQREAAIKRLFPGVSSSRAWVAKTTCEQEYIASVCKQYTGSQQPGYPN